MTYEGEKIKTNDQFSFSFLFFSLSLFIFLSFSHVYMYVCYKATREQRFLPISARVMAASISWPSLVCKVFNLIFPGFNLLHTLSVSCGLVQSICHLLRWQSLMSCQFFYYYYPYMYELLVCL